MQLAAHDDASIGERKLFTDLGRGIPARLFQGRCDLLCADIALGKLFLVHLANSPSSRFSAQNCSNYRSGSFEGVVFCVLSAVDRGEAHPEGVGQFLLGERQLPPHLLERLRKVFGLADHGHLLPV